MKVWKKWEQLVADYLPGGERKSKAELGNAIEDVAWGQFSIECKSTKSMPGYLTKWVAQAEKNCHFALPIVLWHKHYMREGEQLVIMKLKDFRLLGHSYNDLTAFAINKYGEELEEHDERRRNAEATDTSGV